MRTLQRLFPALSATCLSLSAGCALAQTPTPAPNGAAAVKPASDAVITDMSLSHAVNICELAVGAKVPTQTSLPSAARAMAYVIKTLHASQVTSTDTLTPQQLFDGSLIEIVTKVNSGCFNKLNPADQKTVSTLISGIKAAAKLKPAGTP